MPRPVEFHMLSMCVVERVGGQQMLLNSKIPGVPDPVTFEAFADGLEQSIVHLRAITWTATGDEEVAERIVAGFLLQILEQEIPPPAEILSDTIETLYLAYLADALETDIVKIPAVEGESVYLSLEQLSELLR